jgi:geranylgeranyl pyrophosphate synthase
MSTGEIQQLLTAGEESSREDYYRRIEAKTASLCAAATEMAAILAQAQHDQVASLRRFGWELGVAFQIVDDVLDFIGNEAQLGKPAGNDLRQGLMTLPFICYLEKIDDGASADKVCAEVQEGGLAQSGIEAIRASGAVEAAMGEARAHVQLAQQALACLPQGDAYERLLALTEYVVGRNH